MQPRLRRLARVFAVTVAVSIAALANANANAMTDAELTTIVTQRLQGDRTGACFAVAVVDGTVNRTYVCADPEHAGRIGADSAFEIGSVSKTMTAALLADLIVQGKASLDDPLADYLPEGNEVPAFEGQPILLRHVVTHTAGFPALPPGVAITDMDNPYAAMTPADLLAALANVQLTRVPGSQFEYSNYASMLLSYAVARRAGSDFETLLDARLFSPLGMHGAYVKQPPAGIRAAVGHTPNTQATPAWTFDTDFAGVGGVRATLDDMVRYVQAHLGQRESPSDPALQLSQQPIAAGDPEADDAPAMAMNWMLVPLDGRTVHAHEGGTGGFSSFVAFDRQRNRGVVVLSDTALTSVGGLGSLGLHLLDDSLPLGKPRRAATAPDALLDSLVGDYRIDGAIKMSLSRQGDALVIQTADQPPFALAFDDAGDFYPLQFDALLEPQERADGSMGFVWHQGGGALSARRVEVEADTATSTAPRPALSADALKAYAGEYPLTQSLVLTVREQGGKLLAQATGQGAFELTPVAADVFEAADYGVEIRFERGADDEVAALRLLQAGQTLRGERR